MIDANCALEFGACLEGRNALITGGLGGIGAATIQVLLAHGANVAFTYADGHEPEAAAQSVVNRNPQHLSAHPLDLEHAQSIRECIRSAHARWGAIDILVNNAAVGSATVAAYAGDAAGQDTAMLKINADGTLKMCQEFLNLPRSPAHAGAQKLINISSVGGGVGVFPGFKISDGMSKAAIAFMTRQLAAEYTDKAVDIYAVCPGATNTPMFQRSTLDPLNAEQRKNFLERLPKRRLIEPAEIARVLLFLCTPYAAVLHGAVIDASMGLGVRPGLMTEYSH